MSKHLKFQHFNVSIKFQLKIARRDSRNVSRYVKSNNRTLKFQFFQFFPLSEFLQVSLLYFQVNQSIEYYCGPGKET